MTGHKQVEAEKMCLEARLRQSQNMEAIGMLAGGIAHDFNNILSAILGNSELVRRATPEGSAERRYIDNVMQAGRRAKSLIERPTHTLAPSALANNSLQLPAAVFPSTRRHSGVASIPQHYEAAKDRTNKGYSLNTRRSR